MTNDLWFYIFRFIVPYFYITDHLLKYNYKEEDGARLISVIGIFNMIGMIALGFVGDKPWMNVSKTYSVCLIGKAKFNALTLILHYMIWK